MSETVYIETSILGYLTARSTRNLILAANIEVTKEWWDSRRSRFTLYISQVVIDEVARGDTEIAAKRLETVKGLPFVELNQAVRSLSGQFLSRSNLPIFCLRRCSSHCRSNCPRTGLPANVEL